MFFKSLKKPLPFLIFRAFFTLTGASCFLQTPNPTTSATSPIVFKTFPITPSPRFVFLAISPNVPHPCASFLYGSNVIVNALPFFEADCNFFNC